LQYLKDQLWTPLNLLTYAKMSLSSRLLPIHSSYPAGDAWVQREIRLAGPRTLSNYSSGPEGKPAHMVVGRAAVCINLTLSLHPRRCYTLVEGFGQQMAPGEQDLVKTQYTTLLDTCSCWEAPEAWV